MRIIHGDCLAEMDKLITEGVKVDAIITDPPYGTTACKWDTVIPFDAMWERLNKLIKPNGAIVLFGSEPFSSALRMSNIKNYKYDWIWNKSRPTGFLNAKKQPLRKTENISVFYKKQPTYNRQFKEVDERIFTRTKGGGTYGEQKNIPTNVSNGGLENPYTLIDFKCINGEHPTQKPVALMEYLIKTYTNEGETVLDFTMGSGSTGVACKNTNRDFIGIELDENYYNIANDRIEKTIVNKEEHYLQHTQQLDLFDPESIQESIYQGEML